MELFLQYTVLGLVAGGVYGIAASGLVVTYTTSGIFNFAHGAMAMLSAFAYWQLREGWGLPAPVALLVVLGVLAPVLGALIHVVVMRGLRDTSEVTRLIVPISVMLGFLALATWIWNPLEPRTLTKFFGNASTVRIVGIPITYHELLALGLAAAIAGGLWYLFFRTRSGIAMRAVVDDPALLQLNGGRPERLATLSWALGAFLAAVAGILITPIQGGALNAYGLTLLVINAFAAAMFGRLRSLPRTFVGAAVLGLAGSYVTGYFPAGEWTWTGNFRVSIPMVLLFAVLLVLPQDRIRATTVLRTRERFRLPSVGTAVVAGAVLVGVVFLLSRLMAPTAVNSLAYAMTLAVIALSLVLLTGYAGEINLAALSFGGIGALVVYHFGRVGQGPDARTTLTSYLLAAVVCGVVGALVALPALRLRGLYLALATMAFGVFVTNMVFREMNERQLPIVGWRFTLFPGGNLVLPRPRFGPLDLDPMPSFLLFVTVLFAVVGVGLIALRHSSYGRRLAAMKDSPAACATLGMNIVRLKLGVFMVSAAIAGVGGALMTAQIGATNLDRYDIFVSLGLLMLTVVGGIGYVSGALFGGLLFGVGFVAMQNVFDKLGADAPTLEGMFTFLGNFTTVLPAIIGVSLGKKPSGAVHDIVDNFGPVFRARAVLVGAVVAEAVVYVLTLRGTISNWWFVALTTVVILGMAGAGRLYEARRPPGSTGGQPSSPAPTDELAPEQVGLGRAFTVADRDRLDQVLAIRTTSVATIDLRDGRRSGPDLRADLRVDGDGDGGPDGIGATAASTGPAGATNGRR